MTSWPWRKRWPVVTHGRQPLYWNSPSVLSLQSVFYHLEEQIFSRFASPWSFGRTAHGYLSYVGNFRHILSTKKSEIQLHMRRSSKTLQKWIQGCTDRPSNVRNVSTILNIVQVFLVFLAFCFHPALSWKNRLTFFLLPFSLFFPFQKLEQLKTLEMLEHSVCNSQSSKRFVDPDEVKWVAAGSQSKKPAARVFCLSVIFRIEDWFAMRLRKKSCHPPLAPGS